jgi:membrane protein DedA with SNARE-associated domain
MEQLLGWISQYGYAGLFGLLVLGIVGLPVPDETLLVFCGYLISQDKLHPAPTWIAGAGGSMCGISVSYAIGRGLGRGFIHRWGRYVHITEDRLERVHQWFDRIGRWLLVIGYYLPGIRHATALAAGTSGMSFRNFAVFAYAGAVIWVTSFLALGYVLGENWRAALDLVHRYLIIVIVAAAAAGLLVWRLRARVKAKESA